MSKNDAVAAAMSAAWRASLCRYIASSAQFAERSRMTGEV